MSSNSAEHFKKDVRQRERISGPQDRTLEIDFKSPLWRLANMATAATNRLTAPMERQSVHHHHGDIGEMAVLGFEDGDILHRPDAETPEL